MYIYADESGHSGRQIFKKPSLYFQGAVLSVDDSEALLIPIVRRHCERLGIERLHSNELRAGDIARCANEFLEVLEPTAWVFHLTVIHKPYMATTKFVDTVFDSVDNLLVPAIWYQVEPFRHALCCFFDEVLSFQDKQEFWRSFLEDNYKSLQRIIIQTRYNIDPFPIENRLIQVAKEGLEFAIYHPEELALSASKTKKSYKSHTPNVVGFYSLVDSIHDFCEKYSTKPIAFYHDQQSEFGSSMREFYDMFGTVRVKEKPYGIIPSLERTKYGRGKFSLPSSKEMAMLQVVDIFIRLMMKEGIDEFKLAKDRLLSHIKAFHISKETSHAIMHRRLSELYSIDLDEDTVKQGKASMDKLEKDRYARYSAFLKGKNKI